jgi:hypothetical protein
MLRLSVLIILLTIPLRGQAQFFSGEITYKITYVPKSDSVDIQNIIDDNYGTESVYTLSEKRYKSTYFKDGEYTYSYTYNDSTKRMYDDYMGKLYITFRDSRISNGDYTKPLIFKDSTLNVLGHDCYLVVKESERGLTKSYYSADIRVDYNNFEGHKVGNWYENLKAVDGAIALKSTTEHDEYFEIREAVKIEKRNVDESEFMLSNKIIVASFSALDQKIDIKEPTEENINCYQEKVINASKPNGEEFTVYIRIVVLKNGDIEYIKPLQEDEFGFYKVAVDILLYCGLEFIPGKIDGENVNSETYFPIVFLK